MAPKRFVYISRSVSEPRGPYIGLTHDVDARLADHNPGRCPTTRANIVGSDCNTGVSVWRPKS